MTSAGVFRMSGQCLRKPLDVVCDLVPLFDIGCHGSVEVLFTEHVVNRGVPGVVGDSLEEGLEQVVNRKYRH